MVVLKKLVPPENKTLFARFPELNEIWEVPALQRHARTSYEKWGLNKEKTTGEIFAINKSGRTIGIIGWFEYGGCSDILRLRYYGIVPSERGKQYGEKAIHLILEYLARNAPRQYIFLAESVSLNRTAAFRIISHFKAMGFVEFADPHYGENAGCGKVQSLKIRIPGR